MAPPQGREGRTSPYVILTDRELRETILTNPDSKTTLGRIHGVGKAKLERHGEEILGELRADPANTSVDSALGTNDAAQAALGEPSSAEEHQLKAQQP